MLCNQVAHVAADQTHGSGTVSYKRDEHLLARSNYPLYLSHKRFQFFSPINSTQPRNHAPQIFSHSTRLEGNRFSPSYLSTEIFEPKEKVVVPSAACRK